MIHKYTKHTQVSFRLNRPLGGRMQSAGVTLDVSAMSDGFEFSDEADWPAESYAKVVEDAAKTAFENNATEINGLRVALREVDYNHIYSDQRAFYLATMAAIKGYFVIHSEWTDYSSSTNLRG